MPTSIFMEAIVPCLMLFKTEHFMLKRGYICFGLVGFTVLQE